MMRIRQTLTAATAAVLMTVPAAASAGVSSWESTEPPLIPYENEDYALLGGVTFEEGCRGDFDDQLVHVVRPPDRLFRQARWDEPQYLYDLSEWGADDVWDLIDIGCTAVFTGGEVPTPFATGEGSVQWIELDSSAATDLVIVHSRVRGDLVDDSGEVYRVTGRVQAVFTTDGSGGPPDVDNQILTVRER